VAGDGRSDLTLTDDFISVRRFCGPAGNFSAARPDRSRFVDQ